jgi:ATP-dependent RNA helicase DDX5/DBP2
LKQGEGPIVLVLAPTRELAVQIKEECDKFGASSQIKNTVVYGGVKKHTQVRSLQSGVEIVIVRSFVSIFSLSRFDHVT